MKSFKNLEKIYFCEKKTFRNYKMKMNSNKIFP